MGASNPELDRGIDAAVSHLAERQRPDGLWHEPARPGPLHILLGLLGTLYQAPRTQGRVAAESALLRELLAKQSPDGAFAAYPGGPASAPISQLAASTFRAFVTHAPATLEPSLLSQLQSAAAKAKAFAATAPQQEGLSFLELFADIVGDVVEPHAEHNVPALPLVGPLTRAIAVSSLGAPLRARVSLFTTKAIPALAVLVEHTTTRSPLIRAFNAVASPLPLVGRSAALAALTRQILENQGAQGAWLWNIFGTGLNLLALRSLGLGAAHPAVQKGVAFIEAMRHRHPDGDVAQSCCNSEIWDSCTAAVALLHAGVPPDALKAHQLVELLLDDQNPQGLWAFGRAGAEGDVDSSTAALSFLSTCAREELSLAGKVQQAVLRCVRTFLRAQQEDGGFGYSPPPHVAPYSFGRRVPTGVEAGVIDASTADVTGRVLTALGDVLGSGLLPPELRVEVAPAVRLAQRYLEESQAENGSWFGRWSAGYLSSTLFVSRAIARLELPAQARWVQRMRGFVTSSQNADGGFGEVPLADFRPELAGRGPSTPVQTAYGLTALLATAPHPLAELDAAKRAAWHLLERQEHGSWENGVALYTHAFREDYYDAPLLTHAAALEALVSFRQTHQKGRRSPGRH